MTNYNFNALMGIENESAPTEATNTKETSTFDKVVTNAAKIGVIAGATVLTISAVNAIVGEVAVGVKAGKAGFNAAKSRIAAKKAGKVANKAAEMAAFKKSLVEEGFSEDDATAMVKAEYGLEG